MTEKGGPTKSPTSSSTNELLCTVASKSHALLKAFDESTQRMCKVVLRADAVIFPGASRRKEGESWWDQNQRRTAGRQSQPPPRPGSLPFPQPLGTQAEEVLSLADDCRRVSVPLFTAPQKQAKEGELTPSPSPRGEWALGGRRSPLQRHSSPLLRPLCRPALGECHLKRRHGEFPSWRNG